MASSLPQALGSGAHTGYLHHMRLILSRKGFDSSAGGMPSPILPDGTLLSLPIPSHHAEGTGPLRHGHHDLRAVIRDLSRGRIAQDQHYHVDPELGAANPAFGQHGAAARHLRGQRVGPGDLFLFFGWFRRAERIGDAWRWLPGAADCHVLFGWLRVGERLDLSRPTDRQRAETLCPQHPHVAGSGHYGALNDLYLPAPQLGLLPEHPGAGRFDRVHPSRVLTRPGCSRSQWRLPAAFAPRADRTGLSYHDDAGRWQRSGRGVHLRAAARGQEFVIDTTGRPGIVRWLRRVISAQSAG